MNVSLICVFVSVLMMKLTLMSVSSQQSLNQYLNGEITEPPMKVLQVINIVLRFVSLMSH